MIEAQKAMEQYTKYTWFGKRPWAACHVMTITEGIRKLRPSWGEEWANSWQAVIYKGNSNLE